MFGYGRPIEIWRTRGTGGVSGRARLVLLSFLMLFVELMLIRWTGANILYLSYFSNFVLLGSFLGIGIGFLRAHSRVNLFPWAPIGLLLLVEFVLEFPVKINRSGSELVYFGNLAHTTGPPIWVSLPIVFVAVAATMAMIAEGVARAFVQFEPLEAYRLDILGSILGIAAFALLAFAGAPPVLWALVIVLVFAHLYGRTITVLQVIALAGVVVALQGDALSSDARWSPYYEVRVKEDPLGRTIFVNGIGHQTMSSIQTRRRFEPTYFKPYERKAGGTLDDVLVIGAGTGSDVAIALREGARHVDAVEIDPVIADIGREQHPNRPYSDPRVDLHVDDGRAFLERTDEKYDLILFALPDSLTLVAGQSSLRLESYLFTREAMESARDHLKPDGLFGMYNYYREQWLIDRLGRTLEETYGRPPCIDEVGTLGRFALLSATTDPGALRCATPWRPAGEALAPARDDYPFLYLKERGIPNLYLVTLGLILLASLVLIRLLGGPIRQPAGYVDLFFMGAAFLLLETKNVVQFALLFGTTWFVNALVFTGILLAVLAAVELARRVELPRPGVLYAALLAALAIAFAVPQHALLDLDVVPRFVAAVLLAFTPIFMANLVFAQRFKDVGSSAVAFGANLLGAMVGGVLEYASLVVGYRALLLVAALLYGLAFVFGRQHIGARSAAPAPARAFSR